MKTEFSILSAIALLGLSACVNPADKASHAITNKTEDQVATECIVDRDVFRKTITIKSPSVVFVNGSRRTLFMRCIVGQTGAPVYQLYISDHRTSHMGWAFYDTAYDLQGKKLPVTVISRNANSGGSVDEDLGIGYSRAELDAVINPGIDLKLYGKNDQSVYYFPDHYVRGFLKRVDTELTPEIARSTPTSMQRDDVTRN